MKRQRDQIRGAHERPAGREHYYLVLANGEIKHFPWHDTLFDYEVWEFGNCFRQHRDAEHARDSIKHLLQQQGFHAAAPGSRLDKEQLTEEIAGRLRSLFPSYRHEEQEDSVYLVREEDLTRAAVSIADLFSKGL